MDALHISELCRLLVLIVLVASAYTKTADIAGFASSLADGFSVPAALSRPVALAIAGAEWLAASGLLLGGHWARIGAGLALVLFMVFTAAVVQVLVMRRRVSCRCFGRTAHALSALDLIRNSIYIAAAAGYLLLGGSEAIPGGLPAQLSVGLAAMLCFLLSIGMHDIRNLLR